MRWQLSVGAGLLLAIPCIAASAHAQEESSPGDRPPWEEAPGVEESRPTDEREARMEEQERETKLRQEALEKEKNRPDFEVIDDDVHITNVELLDPVPSGQGGLPARGPAEQGAGPDQGPSERDLADDDLQDRYLVDRDLGDRDLPDRDLGDRDLGDRDLPDRDLGDRDLGERAPVRRNVPSPRGR